MVAGHISTYSEYITKLQGTSYAKYSIRSHCNYTALLLKHFTAYWVSNLLPQSDTHSWERRCMGRGSRHASWLAHTVMIQCSASQNPSSYSSRALLWYNHLQKNHVGNTGAPAQTGQTGTTYSSPAHPALTPKAHRSISHVSKPSRETTHTTSHSAR